MKRTHRLNEVIKEIYEVQTAEMTQMFRMCRRAQEHNCNQDFVEALRNEGLAIMRANPEDIVNPFWLDRFTWAFKY